MSIIKFQITCSYEPTDITSQMLSHPHGHPFAQNQNQCGTLMRISKKSRVLFKSNKYLGQRNNRFIQTCVETAVIILKNEILCFKYYQ